MWRHREACVEAKQSLEGIVEMEKLDGFIPSGYLGCDLHVRAKCSLGPFASI